LHPEVKLRYKPALHREASRMEASTYGGKSRRSLAPSELTCPQGTAQNLEVLLACKKSRCLHVLLHPSSPALAVGDMTPLLPRVLLQAAHPQAAKRAGPPHFKHAAPWGWVLWTARLMEAAEVLRSLWKPNSSSGLGRAESCSKHPVQGPSPGKASLGLF